MDESGTLSGFGKDSIAAVGALAIPDRFLPRIADKYARIRRGLPKTNGEVKGRSLNEAQIAEIVSLLVRNQVIFEITLVDVGAHTEALVVAYKSALADQMEQRLPRFNAQAQVRQTVERIRKASAPLFLQAMAAFDVVQTIIKHVPTYFAQRHPAELGNFSWVVDGKDPLKITEWEQWWIWHAQGALANRSRTDPGFRLVGADYSHFARFDGPPGEGTDLKLLMADHRFSSKHEVGVELVDILVNAVRRAAQGNLRKEGWTDIRRLMVHRGQHYINLVLLDGVTAPTSPRYKDVITDFTEGGRSMLSPHFQRMAREERQSSRHNTR